MSAYTGAAAEPAAFDYSFGPQRLPDGRVRFRLWAPGAEQVRILLDACRSEVMHPVGEGFYEAVLSCSPGTPYQYRIGAGRCVPDPASRAHDRLAGAALAGNHPVRSACGAAGWLSRGAGALA
jgi:maltooligosyltrehalose trehalohydrolase